MPAARPRVPGWKPPAPLEEPEEREEQAEDDSDEDADEEDEETDDEAFAKSVGVSRELLRAELARLTESTRPKVPKEPAPPLSPRRAYMRPPASLVLPPVPTALDRTLDSTAGRSLTFFLTVALFGVASVCFVIWGSPERWESGEGLGLLGVGFVATLTMYTMLPSLARRTGMAPSPEGVDWKPYLFIYRISYITAIPALCCFALGYGAQVGFGEGSKATLVQDLEPGSLKYFAATNGYVALNLTKGVIKTRAVALHGQLRLGTGSLRISRYHDAQLRMDYEPFSNAPDPTVPPGALKLYRVAPIFADWQACESQYRISAACLSKSSIVGWAMAETLSPCAALRVANCEPPEPVLQPVYRCRTNPVQGIFEKGPITGICGRVHVPPPDPVLDELKAMLVDDGWAWDYLPNSSQVWIDVQFDPCMADPQACLSRWGIIGGVGIAFAILTAFSVILSAVLDNYVDRTIREARRIYVENERRGKKMIIS